MKILGLAEDYVREPPLPPETLAARLRKAIGTRPKRAFGVLKIRSEWVGLVTGNDFAVWERSQHAVQAHGRIRGRRGGSRVEARIAVRRRSILLSGIFFLLLAIVAVGIVERPEGSSGPGAVAFVAVGAVLVALLFWSSSLRQRAALRRFLDEVFEPKSD